LEHKGDERWTFALIEAVRRGEAWPTRGMPSSQNTDNPGMSVWVFLVLGQITGAQTPTELARVCQWTNVLALVG
jgi:hypothetical protein